MIKKMILSTILSLTISELALAAKVAQVKDKRVLINLDGESASAGSEFFITNAQGKKVAIVRVSQVKGNKAIAEIVKGTAKPGYGVLAKASSSGGATSGGASSAGGNAADAGDSYYDRKLSQRAHTGNSYGVVGGYLLNSMTATFAAGNIVSASRVTANMSGSGFGALGYYDYKLAPSISLRGMGGVEQYKVAGSISTPDCSATTNCSVDLLYMSLYGYGRWTFLPGKYNAWAGGGFGYLYAVGKASTVLRQEQISANQIFVISGGIDYRLNAKTYIPISLEYGLFPSSDSVKASIIYLRAGYAWNL